MSVGERCVGGRHNTPRQQFSYWGRCCFFEPEIETDKKLIEMVLCGVRWCFVLVAADRLVRLANRSIVRLELGWWFWCDGERCKINGIINKSMMGRGTNVAHFSTGKG